jgi:tRNA U34 5-methylaminomethyl-2-thiouridine-forming methyltransferase MnmC
MKKDKKIIITSDGSPTFYMEDWDEYYHSKHGAVSESKYVYIKNGLEYWRDHNFNSKSCSIFEMGFGTGLNSILVYEYALLNKLIIDYNSIDSDPINIESIKNIDFSSFFNHDKTQIIFNKIHVVEWDKENEIDAFFSITKKKQFLQNTTFDKGYDIVFYDAFGSRVQPELWTIQVLKPIVDSMNLNGVIVTYSAKGSFRRALQELGLKVERVEGPKGKREMIRGVKF